MIKSLFCILAFTAAACESTTIISGSITVDPSIAPSTAAPVLVIVDGSQDEPTAAFDPLDQPGDDEAIDYAPGTLAYSYRWEDFGTPGNVVFVGAFIDMDNDGKLGAGEPFGTFAQNPITDPKGGWFADPNLADITIDSVAQ